MKREHIFSHYEQDASRYWKLREGGYASPMSVFQGDEVTFHISNSRSYYDVFVFHEGAKRCLIKEINDLRGALRPDARGRAPRGDLQAVRRLLQEMPTSTLSS